MRKHFFVDALGWDIPHDDAVEMDQYDTPQAQYSLALREGRVLGGARALPTTSRWGAHSYMLGDAMAGKLPDIPADVMPGEIRGLEVRECTRLVISDALTTQAERARCLALIVDGLTAVARAHGVERLISLSPLPLMRALRQLGWQAERIGVPFRDGDGDDDGDRRHYAVLAMPTEKAVQPVRCPAAHLARPQPAAPPAALVH